MLTKHLAKQETEEENKQFLEWVDKDRKNKILFDKVKNIWNEENGGILHLRARFTKHKIKDFIFKQAIGNLVGFSVGLWVTTTFSHYVLERRNIKNLFGLAGRKKVEVNDMPEWFQKCLAVLMGFIALELINHFFQSKKHLVVWEFLKKKYSSVRERK